MGGSNLSRPPTASSSPNQPFVEDSGTVARRKILWLSISDPDCQERYTFAHW